MAQFFIRTKRETGESPLYTKIRRNGIQMYVNTGIRVDIQEWNKAQRSQAAMRRYELTPEGEKVHRLQVEVMKAVDTLYAEGRINTMDDKVLIEQTMSGIVNGTMDEVEQKIHIYEGGARKYVLAYYDYYYNGICDGSIRQGNNKRYADSSIQVWKSFGVYLKQYCKPYVTFDLIDKLFADKFTLFLEEKGLMGNTINKNVSCFRKLCNASAMEGINKNAVSLKVWKDRTVNDEEKRAEIYLTDEEFDAMYELPLTGDEEIVRDIFMLGYFSCQRYSDYSVLKEDNFITYDTGLGLIVLTQKKTGNVVNVPITDSRVNELCQKYHYVFPEVTDQKLNAKIKDVSRKLAEHVPSLQEKFVTQLTLAEKQKEDTYLALIKKKKKGIKFTDNERKWFGKLVKTAYSEKAYFERNKHGEVVRPKHELISSHTSRRSGVTNLYKMNVLTSLELRSISGHKSEQVLEGYVRVGKAENAQRVADKILAAKRRKKE
ncbi:MAG: phage integrase SAM-like domain-containing protein [Prevotella sp.]|nr:phage integrase SAM-like domain-containing protein [Prevotella sp.]